TKTGSDSRHPATPGRGTSRKITATDQRPHPLPFTTSTAPPCDGRSSERRRDSRHASKGSRALGTSDEISSNLKLQSLSLSPMEIGGRKKRKGRHGSKEKEEEDCDNSSCSRGDSLLYPIWGPKL
ncbi:hypothetical protein Prudu_005677, partial [Prunus dulcis]